MTPSSQIRLSDRRWILLGIAWLILGAAVYLWDRPAGSLAWVGLLARLADWIPEIGGQRPLFGVWGRWLPSFCHVMAWSLITAGVLSLRSKPALAAVCLLWLGINTAFELGQKYALQAGNWLPGWPALEPWTDLVGNYFSAGTYDTGDLAAAAMGAVTAGIWLIGGRERGTKWSGG